jgi:hypothetical protein
MFADDGFIFGTADSRPYRIRGGEIFVWTSKPREPISTSSLLDLNSDTFIEERFQVDTIDQSNRDK